MISRRILRIKVLQHVYAFHVSENNDLPAARNSLIKNIDDLTKIFFINIYFFINFIKFYKERLEKNKEKFFPTEDDLNPSTVIIDNFFIYNLLENEDLKYGLANLSLDFPFESDLFWDVYKKIKDWHIYQSFVVKNKYGLVDYQKFYSKLFKQFIAFHPLLKSYLESGNILWSEDQNTMALITYMWLKNYDPLDYESTLPPQPFKPIKNIGDEDDKEFVITLFDNTILNKNKWDEAIQKHTKNWELQRLNLLDRYIIHQAITEIVYCPTIPLKTSIDEYIEIALQFCTEKSHIFINGLLQAIIDDYNKQGLIHKTGRGLVGN